MTFEFVLKIHDIRMQCMQFCMDWRHVAFDWSAIRAFLATAEEGSFSAAARVTSSTQPTIGRQVTALEEELGVVLFERVGRGLALTPTGLELVEHARTMGDAALRLSRIAAGQSESLNGSVCISASEVISTYLLPPVLGRIRARHPGIQLELVVTNQVSDLALREADIALRNFRPKDPDLVAKKASEHQAYLYATPEYLRSLGNPETLEQLAQGQFIAFDHTDVFRNGLAELGLLLEPSSFGWVTSNQMVQWALVTQGSGIGVMMAEVGDADPRVVRVLPDRLAFPFSTWITSHREVKTSRRVRTVFDLLVEAWQAPTRVGAG
jgi:DNA-binding transcriptional LysR family regulator